MVKISESKNSRAIGLKVFILCLAVAVFVIPHHELYASGNSGGGSGGTSSSSSDSGSAGGSSRGGSTVMKNMREARDKMNERLASNAKNEEAHSGKSQVAGEKSAKTELPFDLNHREWTEILQSSVTFYDDRAASAIDYAKVDKAKLKRYTSTLLDASRAQIDGLSREDQLAYYFNLYNALTVQRVLEKYPKIESFKEFGTGIGPFGDSAWEVPFFNLFGEKSYLDRIEHEIVREKFVEPRLHFAFNCASVGCPALLKRAFVGSELEGQLEAATKGFLSDKLRNRVSKDQSELEVSKIFSWYEEDFEKGWRGTNSLKEFFAKYASFLSDDPKIVKRIESKKLDIDHLSYSWLLNTPANTKKWRAQEKKN
jgi:hypothetical protein